MNPRRNLPWVRSPARQPDWTPPRPLPLPTAPPRETFFANLGADGTDPATLAQMQQFCAAFGGLMAEVQQFLAENGLDDPAKV